MATLAEVEILNENLLRALRRELAPGIVEMQRKGETAVAAGVLHEPVSFFHDPAGFAREHQTLFRQMPVVACLSAQVPEPGSFVLMGLGVLAIGAAMRRRQA